MRYCGIIILSLLLACKVEQPTASVEPHQEDLSVLRPSLDSAVFKISEPVSETYVPLEGHIKNELDSIVRYSIAKNKEEKKVQGYIIQVYTGNSREAANNIWGLVNDSFPELNPKISYQQPNFRVKAGRFTDRLRAHRIFNRVKEEFPKAKLVPERFVGYYE